jgi:hypothetical protein
MNKGLNNKYEQSGKFNTALFNQDFKILEDKQIKQALTIETEGTNTAGNLGIAGSLVFQNKNAFHEYFLIFVKLIMVR